ncbi:aurora kinase A and ninein-interacting protein isoform X2 [Nannospalax galili]|uniref:Aurora kinase A and ninein interacting protein n=1 Tax=Nannospalax galili TaxID=1026970 RepID=A0A8C6R117_NANGA|nr:aurora kinase A and ninein-interacting protein isoform X2 [Nannospalax galili]
MRHRGREEEACGVWLDAAALKKRKVQTHLIKQGTKILALLPGERKSSISFTQRSSTRQTSMTSFVTLRPGMTNGGDQKSSSSPIESHLNKESKKDATRIDSLVQELGGDCLVPPLATSTPADIQETGLSPQSLQTSDHHGLGTPVLTVLSLPQPDILVCAEEHRASLALSFTQDLENSCLLNQRENKRKREWLHGLKTICPGIESHVRSPEGKCHHCSDKAELGKRSAKENRQAPVHLQTSRESWSRKKTRPVTKSLCPLSLFSWDSEKDKDSWSQLFTEDSQGQQVIAHNTRMPFQDVTNAWNQGLGQFPGIPWAQGQDGPTQLHLQPDLLFTQDSEGNQVIRH